MRRVNLLCEATGKERPCDFRKADWDTYEETCLSGLDSVRDELVEVLGSSISSLLLSAAPEAVAARLIVSWWYQVCDEVVRNRAYRWLRRFPVESNLKMYQRLTAVARQVIISAKRTCCRDYSEKEGKEHFPYRAAVCVALYVQHSWKNWKASI